jgi:formylglycine-generating enzyme required for sulfatase activity
LDLKTIGLSMLAFSFVVLYLILKWDFSKFQDEAKVREARMQTTMKQQDLAFQLKTKELEADKKTVIKIVEEKKIDLDKNFAEKSESADYYKRLNDENRAYHVEKLKALKDQVRGAFEILIKEADKSLVAGDYKNAEILCRACLLLKPEETALLNLKSRIEAFRFTNRVGMSFVKIPKGDFKMGSIPTEKLRGLDEDSHKVTLTNNFFMMETEVTQEQWDAVMNAPNGELRNLSVIVTPSLEKGLDLPVENVSYHDANNFVIKINQMGIGQYRLPTEAEWEYAARANEKGAFGENEAPEATAWFSKNSQKKSHKVRTRFPNSFGLYDMLGNVSEWTSDYYASYGDPGSASVAVVDPKVTENTGFRSYRGGSFKDSDSACRIANRNKAKDDYKAEFIGFRLVYQP